MRVAVIGSGVAGLACSRLLRQQEISVTLIERFSKPGMDAHSVQVDLPGLPCQQADVPSRMFNQTQWPELYKLYQTLGVQSTTVDTSQSFSIFGGKTFLKLNRANRPTIRSVLFDDQARHLVTQAEKLQRLGLADLQADRNDLVSRTFASYLDGRGFTREFVEMFLYPTLSSTVCTCSYAALDDYPARTMLQSLKNLTDETNLLRAKFGTGDVVQRLLHPQVETRLGTEVAAVTQNGSQVCVTLSDGDQQSFDHVVLATTAKAGVQLAKQIEPAEKAVLQSFPYESISVIVHEDASFMPTKKSDWSTFNMLVCPQRAAAMCTVWLNQFHDWPDSDTNVFQTINVFSAPDPAKTICTAQLQRPVLNLDSDQQWQALDRMHRQVGRRLWFCGSYAGRGMPLLESGLNSAAEVSQRIIAQYPTQNASQLH